MKIHLTQPNGARKEMSEIVDEAIENGSFNTEIVAKCDKNMIDIIILSIREKLGDKYTIKGNKTLFFNKKIQK